MKNQKINPKSTGLWDQLNESSKRVYLSPTTSVRFEILDFFDDFQYRQEGEELVAKVEYLYNSKVISENELDTLVKMIKSSDRENRILAEAIIEEKGEDFEFPKKEREIVLMTGAGGMKALNGAIQNLVQNK